MTHAEKRMLIAAHEQAEAAHRQVIVLTELVTRLMDRKPGRPSRDDAERLESAKQKAEEWLELQTNS